MTAFIQKIERTRECPDWTGGECERHDCRHKDLRDLAQKECSKYRGHNMGLGDIANPAERVQAVVTARALLVEVTLVQVNARKPATYEMAAEMVRQLAHIRCSMDMRSAAADVALEKPQLVRTKKAPRVEEAAEKDGARPVREAIEEHAAAEKEWLEQRGAGGETHAAITQRTRDLYVEHEKKRTRA